MLFVVAALRTWFSTVGGAGPPQSALADLGRKADSIAAAAAAQFGSSVRVVGSEFPPATWWTWLKMGRVSFQRDGGQVHHYETVERTTRSGDIDGVEAVAVINAKPLTTPAALFRDPDSLIPLILNWRPPIGCASIEIPAGLVDEGESAAVAAERELLEETGLHGTVLPEHSRIFHVSPWVSNENGRYVFLRVDPCDPRNATPRQNLGDDENIELLIVPVKDLSARLEKYHDDHGFAIDARLYSFAIALSFIQHE